MEVLRGTRLRSINFQIRQYEYLTVVVLRSEKDSLTF